MLNTPIFFLEFDWQSSMRDNSKQQNINGNAITSYLQTNFLPDVNYAL